RSITLNLKHPEAGSVLRKMVRRADVILENFRPGTMKKLGLDYESLRAVNPCIIYAACSGFGHTGPYSLRPAYDQIVQGMAGVMSITGHPGGPPTRVGTSIGDITAGLFTAIGVLSALHYRDKTGVGQFIDVAMLDCQVAILENAIARYFVTAEEPGQVGNRHPSLAPFTAIATGDGHINIAVGNDTLWEKLCTAIDRPGLANDSRFATNALRVSNWPELDSILSEVFAGKTSADWLEILEKQGVPCGPINSIGGVVNDPQVSARGMIVETDHPVAGRVKMAGIPIKMSETPLTIDRPAPTLGQHTSEILSEFGFSAGDIEWLIEQGVV
ncbi:MAG: CaiB/BaiF CoA transferase family protein, partial [Bacillota bacterium]